MPYLDIPACTTTRRDADLLRRQPAPRGDRSRVDLQGFEAATIADHQVMTSADLQAVNTLNEPIERDAEKGSRATVADGALTARLPPYSYQMIRLALA